MTREEAIKIIDCYDIGFYDLSGEKIPADKLAEAFDMAIEALSVANLKSEFESAVPNCQKCAIKELWKETEKEDLVSVVRCKDCINYETCNLRLSHWWKGGYTVDIEFCSFGERREP